MKFKIYNPDMVDCSSSANMLVPSPESMRVILDLFLTICNSPAVESLLSYQVQLEFEDLTLHIISPDGSLYRRSNPRRGRINELKPQYSLRTSDLDRENKIYGLFIESLENAQISAPQRIVRSYQGSGMYHVSFPGIQGLRNVMGIIHAILSSNVSMIPSSIQNKELINFEFIAKIVWRAWSNFQQAPNIGDLQCGEADTISASSRRMEFNLGGITLGGQQGIPNGDKHFADVQKAINQAYPQYMIKEIGDSAAETDGRMALYREASQEELLNIEADGIFYGKKILQEDKKILLEILFHVKQLFDANISNYMNTYKLQNGHVIELTLINPNLSLVLPIVDQFPNLETLSITLPTFSGILDLLPLKRLKILRILSCLAIQTISESIREYQNLEKLVIKNCSKLTRLPNSITEIPNLKWLQVEGCDQISSFPPNMINSSLETLIISRCTRLRDVRINNDREGCKKYFQENVEKEG